MKETNEERAKRLLLMDGDYYTPQDFGFATLDDMKIDRGFITLIDGHSYYLGNRIKT